MSSVVDICNLALANIGCTEFITSIESTDGMSKEAMLCARFWPIVRDSLLRDAAPSFARKRSGLADTGETSDQWGYIYSYPSDCLRALYIESGTRKPTKGQKVEFEKGVSGSGNVIFTDMEDAELVYVCRVEDTELWDVSFTEAASWYLAARLSMPMSVSPALSQSVADMARRSLDLAVANDLNEGEEGPEPDCDLLTARQ